MKTVLLVDGDPAGGRMMEISLQRLGGYRVIQSNDPQEIFALTSQRQVHVIIMDVTLHGCIYEGRPIDGLEISRRIKSDSHSSSIPILLSTAHAMRGDEERLLNESHADAYLAKPIVDPRDLVKAVEALIQRHNAGL